jgi:hypothetical protein
MIGMDRLIKELQRHVTLELPEGVPLVLPGLMVDAETTPEWVEFSCDAINGLAQRTSPAELREVVITLQVFVRASKQTVRVQALAEAVRGIVSRRVVDIVNRDLSEEPVVGAVRFREADVRDLTRAHGELQRRALRHAVVTARGLVQAFVEAD